MKPKYAFSKLLNRSGFNSIAAISYSIDKRRYGDSKGSRRTNAELLISDCSDVISLHFNWKTKREKANSLYKIEVIRKALSELEFAIEQESEKNAKTKTSRKKRTFNEIFPIK